MLEIYNVHSKIIQDDNLMLVNTKKNIEERSSLIRLSGEIIAKTFPNLDKLEENLAKIHWKKWVKPPFKLRIKDLTRKYKHKVSLLERYLAKYIWQGINNPSVDLKKPKTTIYIILTSKHFYIIKLSWEAQTNRFKDREPNSKPAFHPTILKPWLARVLVNLARTKKELLDPFCGTGSILMEGALIGAKVYGSDLDSRMLDRTKENLEHFNIKAKLRKIDATKLSKYYKKISAIVTDPPYRRSSYSSKENISELYNEFLKEASVILEKNKYICLMIPKGVKIKIPRELKLKEQAELYVHGGLTRRILVLKNEK
ncbi:MAG: RsmD family RNA methyltransferase [Clostridiales bacterium]|nr:RsmD family RNA methyltransferase [Clostridiales bacterium]